MATLLPPQMVINSRMLYFGWIPADPDAVAALVDKRLQIADNQAIFMNQYVVDDENQTSGFGSYSLTYIGPDLAGHDVPDGSGTPARWWTHYFNSSPDMRAYASARGVPASPGRTTIEKSGNEIVVTTYSDDTPVIRTTATASDEIAVVGRGQLHYITDIGGDLILGRYPFVADIADGWSITSLEFLDPSHSVYALRPVDPLQITWGFYSPAASFCYPGGEERI
jgi:hypothetical protein